MAPEPTYPFVPKSNRWLQPGQYWQVPLSDGRFACGRVMKVPAFKTPSRTTFIAGLMDWVGSRPPSGADLAGRSVLDQGMTSYRAVSQMGAQVLGIRPLELDGLTFDPDAAGTGVHGKSRVWGDAFLAIRAEMEFNRRGNDEAVADVRRRFDVPEPDPSALRRLGGFPEPS